MTCAPEHFRKLLILRSSNSISDRLHARPDLFTDSEESSEPSTAFRVTTFTGDRRAVAYALAIVAAIFGSFLHGTVATRMCAFLRFLVSHRISLPQAESTTQQCGMDG